ncbi:hypothetical protein FQZ97_956260 [compost metagenome]
MQHLRFLVVDLSNAMPAVLAHDAETLPVSDRLDGMAHIAQRRSRLDLPDAGQHGFVCRLHQPPRQSGRGTHEVHATGVAEPAILDDSNIDVDDVALLQNLVGRGDAVAHDLIDRGEDGFRITVVPHVGRNGALNIDDVVVADPVQRLRAHTRHDVRPDHVENLRGQTAGPPCHLDVFGGLDGNTATH